MMQRKKDSANLRKNYGIFLQISLVIVLLVFIVASKVQFVAENQEVDLTQEQEVVEMEEVTQTKQEEKPPPPPRPQVPVEVPNDEIIEDQDINIDADINMDEPLPEPEEPAEEQEEDFFVAVEEMPKLKGGQEWLYNQIEYPDMARKAGIEGRVIVQFVVDEKSNATNFEVLRGIGGGCDEEAVRILKEADFEAGRQRGKPVAVQMAQPITFELKN